MTNHKVHGIVHEERTLLDTLQQKQKKIIAACLWARVQDSMLKIFTERKTRRKKLETEENATELHIDSPCIYLLASRCWGHTPRQHYCLSSFTQISRSFDSWLCFSGLFLVDLVLSCTHGTSQYSPSRLEPKKDEKVKPIERQADIFTEQTSGKTCWLTRRPSRPSRKTLE